MLCMFSCIMLRWFERSLIESIELKLEFSDNVSEAGPGFG